LLEFCSQKELVLQTGHSVDQWPLVLVKELFDNALDAAEEAGTAPAHWYDPERFERLIAAYVADDQDRQRTRTVREFVAEFRGMSGTAKQKQVLDETSTARMALAELFADGKADKVKIANLLSAIQRSTKSVKPQEHGIICWSPDCHRNRIRLLPGRDGNSSPDHRSKLVGRHQQPLPAARRQRREPRHVPRNAAGWPQRTSYPASAPRIATNRLHGPGKKRTGPGGVITSADNQEDENED
jgi:hypothetical protein